MRLASSSLASCGTLDAAATPHPVCASAAIRAATATLSGATVRSTAPNPTQLAIHNRRTAVGHYTRTFPFCWDSVDQLGDLERLKLVLDALPDEPLMQLLERRRGHGRNDYPVRSMWNSLIAGFVFQHPSIAALRRELLRNGQLRDSCGFDPFEGAAAVPTEYAYTRFQRRLHKYQRQVDELFQSALEELQIELPDLGQVQALDGKELHSLAKGESSYPLPEDETQEDSDGRRDRDADWGVKGSGKKKRYWFGYLLHLVVDASYELPLAFEVTTASRGEQPQAQRLLDQMQERHPELLERCSRLSADKGYDDHKLINRLWDQHQIKPDHRHSQLLAGTGRRTTTAWSPSW